jgi:hypothetical protein
MASVIPKQEARLAPTTLNTRPTRSTLIDELSQVRPEKPTVLFL